MFFCFLKTIFLLFYLSSEIVSLFISNLFFKLSILPHQVVPSLVSSVRVRVLRP